MITISFACTPISSVLPTSYLTRERISRRSESTSRLPTPHFVESHLAFCSSLVWSFFHFGLPHMECSICLSSLEEDSRTLPCGHSFHCDCVLKWEKCSLTCPLCRHPIPQSLRIRKRYHIRCVIQCHTMLFESLPFNEVTEEEMRALSLSLGGGGTVQKSHIVDQMWFSVRVRGRREMESKLSLCNVIETDAISIFLSSIVAEL